MKGTVQTGQEHLEGGGMTGWKTIFGPEGKLLWGLEITLLIGLMFWSRHVEQLNFQKIQLGFTLPTLFFLLAKLGILAVVHLLYRRICLWIMDFRCHKNQVFFVLLNTAVFSIILFIFLSNGILGSVLHSDMERIRKAISVFDWCFYQGWYANVFYMMGHMLFPPSWLLVGQVLLQAGGLVFIFAYLQQSMQKRFGRMAALGVLVLCYAPPSLVFSQFTLRASWLGYSLALLVLLWYDLLWTAPVPSKSRLIWVLLFTAFVSTLRPETVYCIPVALLLLAVVLRRGVEISRIKSFLFPVVLLLFYILLRLPQVDGLEYRTAPFLNPLSNMLAAEGFNYWNEEEDLQAINGIIDAEVLKRNHSTTDLKAVHLERDAWNINNSDQEYHDFVLAYGRLVLKNPAIWLAARWETFWLTNCTGSALAYDFLLNRLGVENSLVKGVFFLCYLSVIPLALGAMLTVAAMIRRKEGWRQFLLSCLVFGEAAMMFVLQTQTEYMFHFAFWFPAWFLCIILLCRLSEEKKYVGKTKEKQIFI